MQHDEYFHSQKDDKENVLLRLEPGNNIIVHIIWSYCTILVLVIFVIAPQLSKLLIIIMQLQALTYILLYMHTIMLFAVHPDPPDVDTPIVLSFETHM